LSAKMWYTNCRSMEKNKSIVIEKGKEGIDRWEFEVRVGGRIYEVEVEKEYVRKLTKNKISPRDLVMYSFLFLLEREPASAILPSFNLDQIPTPLKRFNLCLC